ncbi:glycosyltransferase family 4 protein [Paracraurococcus lichenis]|uniref:Glycosyltransferase family 4 protein n=1 Tax=Paracraurococcus lichenis TaxID=3064888 RepID=A0ABT9E2J5_9PROT|nr:glycosyltransferase family 4 protein [Paracraurococcus sp. LOR1-02]MDO9710391.1 glycosyltransferase family 4 protein [Paracraurococcus sp. LOR1-02]
MRILQLTQFYPPVIGGEERHVRNLGAALARRGHEVSVATLRHPAAAVEEMDGDVRVLRLRGTLQRVGSLFTESDRRLAPPFPDPELLAGLARVMRRQRPDIVHAHNWIVHSYLPLRPLFPARLVQTLHDYSLVCARKNLMRQGRPCSGPALGKCLTCARAHYGTAKGTVTALATRASSPLVRSGVDRFLAVSCAVAALNGLEGHCEVVPNFIPDDLGAPPAIPPALPELLPDAPYMLFVGDLNYQKGVPVLLQAYRRLQDAPPLVLIGRSYAEELRDLPPGVRVFSSWPHAAVLEAWRRCMFGLAPSVWPEPCATVVMEAMAFGKPMIVTDIGGMPDLVEGGRNGLLVPPGDAEALAAGMQRLLNDPGLRAQLAAGCLERIETLKAASVVARIEAIYRDLLAKDASQRRNSEGAVHALPAERS